MMRAFLAAMFCISTTAPAAAGNAERLAAQLTHAANAEDPYGALGDLLLEWDERLGRVTVETFVRNQTAAQRRQSAILSGSCDSFRALERSAFLKQFPRLRPIAESPKHGALVETAIFRALADRGVCEANAAIARSLASIGDELAPTFPLHLSPAPDGMAWLPRMTRGVEPIDAIAKALGRLHEAAICGNDAIALASLIGYMHAPKLIAFSPPRAHYVLERARALGIDTSAAGRASISHDPANLSHEARERLAHLAWSAKTDLDPELLPHWARNCARPPTWQE